MAPSPERRQQLQSASRNHLPGTRRRDGPRRHGLGTPPGGRRRGRRILPPSWGGGVGDPRTPQETPQGTPQPLQPATSQQMPQGDPQPLRRIRVSGEDAVFREALQAAYREEASGAPPQADSAPEHQQPAQRGVIALPLPDGWAHLDTLDLVTEYRLRVPTMDDVPFTIRADYARIQAASLCTLRIAYDLGEGAPIIRGRKLFCLLSRMLLFLIRKRFASAILQECVAGKMKEKRETDRMKP